MDNSWQPETGGCIGAVDDVDLPGYQVGELLGFGAAGEVWRGVEVATGEAVALKRIRIGEDRGALTGRVLAGLQREADQLAGKELPHLVRLRAVIGEVAVYDFADGGSLAGVLARRQTLTPGEVVTVAAPLARTLAQLHAAGLAHGDVTASAVLFTADGMPLLSDLGLTRLTAQARAAGDAAPTGSAGAAADAEPGPAGAGEDVRALSALCHRVLGGAPPGDTDDREPLGALAPLAPQSLVVAIEAGLAGDPAARPDAASLADALSRSCTATPVSLRGAPVRPRGRVGTGEPAAAVMDLASREPRSTGGTAGSGTAGSGTAGSGTAGSGSGGSSSVGHGLRPSWRRAFAGPSRSGPERRVSRPAVAVLAGAVTLAVAAMVGWGLGRSVLVEAAQLEPAAAFASADLPAPPPTQHPTPAPLVASPATTEDAYPETARPSGTSSAPTTVAVPGSRRLPAPPVPTTSTPSRQRPAAPAPRPAATGWPGVLDELDATRAQAFATAQAGLLAQVHAPGSSGLAADRAAVTVLARAGRTATGVRHQVQSLNVLSRNDRQVRLHVVDAMSPQQIVDGDGAVVERRPPRPPEEWIVTLQTVGGRWRIASIVAGHPGWG